jgi:hypothetical protein
MPLLPQQLPIDLGMEPGQQFALGLGTELWAGGKAKDALFVIHNIRVIGMANTFPRIEH